MDAPDSVTSVHEKHPELTNTLDRQTIDRITADILSDLG
jgi:hypothetical protein